MKLSDLRKQVKSLPKGDHVKIELPSTDALQWLCNEVDLNRFISEHGDVEVEITHDYWGRPFAAVPSFAESRKAANEVKARDCARWGCN